MRRCALIVVLICAVVLPLRAQEEFLLGDFDQSGDLSISRLQIVRSFLSRCGPPSSDGPC